MPRWHTGKRSRLRSPAAGIVVAHKLIDAARARSRAVNATDEQAA